MICFCYATWIVLEATGKQPILVHVCACEYAHKCTSMYVLSFLCVPVVYL